MGRTEEFSLFIQFRNTLEHEQNNLVRFDTQEILKLPSSQKKSKGEKTNPPKRFSPLIFLRWG